MTASHATIEPMSHHPDHAAAVAHLEDAMTSLDHDRSVSWDEVGRRAITHDPRAGLTDQYRLAEGAELEQLVARLREHG